MTAKPSTGRKKREPTPEEIATRKEFGRRLTKAMDNAGVRPVDMHFALKITQASISNYRLGKQYPEFETILKIAKYLKVHIAQLVEPADVADPPYDGWRDFIASTEGPSLTKEEHVSLALFYWPEDATPTQGSYHALLQTLRAAPKNH